MESGYSSLALDRQGSGGSPRPVHGMGFSSRPQGITTPMILTQLGRLVGSDMESARLRTEATITASLSLVWPAKGEVVSSRSDSLNVAAVHINGAFQNLPFTKAPGSFLGKQLGRQRLQGRRDAGRDGGDAEVLSGVLCTCSLLISVASLSTLCHRRLSPACAPTPSQVRGRDFCSASKYCTLRH